MVPKGFDAVELFAKAEFVVGAGLPNPELPNGLGLLAAVPPNADVVDWDPEPKGEAFVFVVVELPKVELPKAELAKPDGFAVLFENADDDPNAGVFDRVPEPKLELPNPDGVLAELSKLEFPNPADPNAPPALAGAEPNPAFPNPPELLWDPKPLFPKPLLPKPLLVAGLLNPLLPNPVDPKADPDPELAPTLPPNPAEPNPELPLPLLAPALEPNPLFPNPFPPLA